MKPFLLYIVSLFNLILISCEEKTIRITNTSKEIADSITIDINFKRIAILKNVTPKFDSVVTYSSDSFDLRHDVLLRIIVYKKDSILGSYENFNDLGGIETNMTFEIKDSFQVKKLPKKY